MPSVADAGVHGGTAAQPWGGRVMPDLLTLLLQISVILVAVRLVGLAFRRIVNITEQRYIDCWSPASRGTDDKKLSG